MSPRARRLAVGGWAVLVLLTALPALASGYRSAWVLAALAGCVLAPFALVALSRLARVPRWSAGVAGVVLATVVALVLADRVDPAAGALPGWRSSPAFSVLGPLVDTVPRLLTAPRPAPAEPGLVVPVALLVWLAALTVAIAVVGSRRAGVAPLVGAVVLHTAGALLTAGRGDALGTGALATAIALLLGWVLLPSRSEDPATLADPRGTTSNASPAASDARRRDRRPTGRGVLLPAVVAAVAATFALTAAAVPTARSFEPRTLVPPPQLPVEATNPMPDLALWSSGGDETLFDVTAADGALPERLAVATLPDFDGAVWRLDARLRPVGVVATPDTAPGRATRTATYTLTPGGIGGVWVPSAGTATDVTGSVLLDLDTGSLVAPTGWREEVTVTTTIDDPEPAAVARAAVPPASQVQRYLLLPRTPEHLRETATRVTSGVTSRWEQVSLLVDAVRTDDLREGATGQERLLDPAAPSGSSYGRVTRFLFSAAEEGGQVGTSEQFAASFAMLARASGIPARLVLGFDLGPDAADGAVEVRGESARVWAQVYLSGVGWVDVDPSPDSATSSDLPTPDPQDAGGDDPADEPADSDDRQPAEIADDDAAPDGAASAAPLALALGVLGLAVAGAVGLGIARALRARRWRRAGPPGAWAQVEDAMRLAGRPVPPSSTATDLARGLPESLVPTALALAERAEATTYAPPGATVPDEVAAWDLGREVSGDLRRRAGAATRLLWPLSPRVWRR